MRLIDADAILKKMRSSMDMQELYLPTHFFDFVIEEMPTIETKPVKHGKWIIKHNLISCSNCRKSNWDIVFKDTLDGFDFCPKCGARMDGVST